ncbi:DUF2066 domain-containing protein [Marinobacterium rhizophilum]|uniref:DUF2066 domain-containing protein n=1 Tax=Marinobacterium rhizophilum TaxID=420402 RepID=A0ABY5HQW0_9GAMM|nr:DUF2066 domain-containing protein [Marinobacterium rhizophilum]UTW13565.1 DUF2066 domain-containing protein [Marinobacterium rhizophilum]
MFIKYLRQTFACVALLWAISAGAVAVPDLYRAEINASATEIQPSERQVSEGLAQVLIKLSGDTEVADREGYPLLLDQAQELLLEYAYQSTADGGRQLRLDYDGARLDALLRELGIPGPGAQRPALLLWLVHKEAGAGEDYIAADHPAMQALMAQAQRRGLALQLPLLDLQDLQNLPPEQLWRQAADAVRRASRRYAPEAVLAGRVWYEGGYWFSEFEFSGERWEAQRFAPAGELDAQMMDVVDTVADRLLESAAPAPLQYRPQGLVLQVEGINSQGDYLALVERLRAIDGVTAVFPQLLSRERLRLHVQLDSSVERLQEALRLDSQLEPVGRSVGAESGDESLLQYRWQSREFGRRDGMQ